MKHLQDYFYKEGPIVVYDEEQVVPIELREGNGLYAETDYRVYVTFKDAYTNEIGV